MAGRRRLQRSVRITVAAILLGVAACGVALAVASSVLIGPVAVLTLAAGAASTRMVYAELVQTRVEAARDRAEQARRHLVDSQRRAADHEATVATMRTGLQQRELTIRHLGGQVLALGRRADEAEDRVRREARRANEAQDRLAALIDEVLGTVDPDADADREAHARVDALVGQRATDERREPPTVLALVDWANRPTPATSDQTGWAGSRTA